MDAEFWHERWRSNQIAFHQPQVNAALVAHWARLDPRPGEPVLVPLCGKSLDMRWLAQAGHPVVGVEIDPIAVAAFFADEDLAPTRTPAGALVEYAAGPYRLLQGDFLATRPADTGGARLVYDRAALVALPPAMRPGYCAHLRALLPADARLLLLTFEYDQERSKGPPFAVPEAEVRGQFGDAFDIECLERRDILDSEPRFRERGLTSMVEIVWHLRGRGA